MRKKKGPSKLLICGLITAGAFYYVSHRKPVGVPKKESSPVKEKKKKSSGMIRPLLLSLLMLVGYASADAAYPPVIPPSRSTVPSSERNIPADAPASRAFPDTLDDLKQDLAAYIKTLDGDWSLYLKDLGTEEYFIINDKALPAASLIKLFVAGAYFDKVEKGEIEHNDWTEKTLQAMLSYSSNEAWISLETIIGHGSYVAGYHYVTEFAQNLGCKDTGRVIGPAELFYQNGGNYTSVKDVGYVLNLIYHDEFVSKKCSDTVLHYLEEQVRTQKIPSGIPEGEAETANKTGELVGTESDAAIIFGERTDYILVIIGDRVSSAGVYDIFTDLSAMVFDFMEDRDAKHTPSAASSYRKNTDGSPSEDTRKIKG